MLHGHPWGLHHLLYLVVAYRVIKIVNNLQKMLVAAQGSWQYGGMKNTPNKQDEYVCCSEKKRNEAVSFHDFGVCDEQNRPIGSRITTFDLNRTKIKENKYGPICTKEELGLFYVFIPSSTRNKKAFGAYQGERYFRTQKERSDEIKKYLELSRKRYTNKFNK